MPGSTPRLGSVASVFVSRWDAAVMERVPEPLRGRLGIAMAGRIYKSYRELLSSPRWQRAFNAGARPQRLLWASTGTKDPKASDVLYIKALAAPFTVNTMPEGTLKAFADHGDIGPILPADGGDCEDVLVQFAKGRHQPRRPGRPAPGRRSEVVCEVLERTHGGDRVEERGLDNQKETKGATRMTAGLSIHSTHGPHGRHSSPTISRCGNCTFASSSRMIPSAASG